MTGQAEHFALRFLVIFSQSACFWPLPILKLGHLCFCYSFAVFFFFISYAFICQLRALGMFFPSPHLPSAFLSDALRGRHMSRSLSDQLPLLWLVLGLLL